MKTESFSVSPETIPGTRLLNAVHEIGPLLGRDVEQEADKRRLSQPVIDALRQAGLFRLFMPKSLGGLEADPVITGRVVEEVARHNTAAAWAVMVANTATWWCSRLSQKGIEKVYEQNGANTFIAGAFHPPMKATPTDDGFLINGTSPLTSHVHEAHWLFVTAFVMENDHIKMNNGIPEIIGAFMKPENCQILDTWYTIGMKATDSNDISANNVFVPKYLSYALTPEFEPTSHYAGLLYKFPAIGASIASLIAPVAIAVARNAIEELKLIADKKVPFGSAVSIRERGAVQRKVGLAESFVQSSRAFLFHELMACWNKTLAEEKVSLKDRANLLLAVTHTNQTCAQAVDLMYSAAGTSGIYWKNKLARYFTDAQVIRQHGFSNDSRYETAAQVYFGLQPDLPALLF